MAGSSPRRPSSPGPESGEHGNLPLLIGINGKSYDIGRIDLETKLGTTEVWEVVSMGMAHPFHVHGRPVSGLHNMLQANCSK